MRSPNTFTPTRGIAKILCPALNTSTSTPLIARSYGEFSGHEFSRTGRTPPPAPRLRPIPLPPLDFIGKQIGDMENAISPRQRQIFIHRSLMHPLAYSSLSYDISISPSTHFKSEDLLESAFWPFPTRIEVVCDGFPWRIEIISSQDTPLTCFAILSEIHSALTRPVSELEWAVTSPSMQRVAWDAFVARVQQGASRFNQGVQRLDFLSRRTLFRGLSPFEDISDKWVMHLDAR